MNFKLLESKTAANAAKLGTYGVIKGAVNYIGATIKKQDYARALGYEFEKLILYITSLGLGSCWLGGTFKKVSLPKAMSVQDDEFFPVISPVGYPSDKKRLVDSIIRFMVHENLRKPWEELFFIKTSPHLYPNQMLGSTGSLGNGAAGAFCFKQAALENS